MSTTPLKIHWLAQFSDGSQLEQFEANGKENLFRGVLNRQNDLTRFILFHTEKSLRFTLDLKLGVIYINDIQMPQPELLSNVDDKNRKRLIYFRRITKELNSFKGTVSTTNTTVLYFLGYQYNNEIGKNFKKILQINNEGNIII